MLSLRLVHSQGSAAMPAEGLLELVWPALAWSGLAASLL